jgi:hypothetical protein
MNYADARLRLANHANLPGEQLPEAESLGWVLWNATRTGTKPNLAPLLADIIACLEVVNHELNSPIPSESKGQMTEAVIAEVAYSVSGILVDGLRYHRQWVRESLFEDADRGALADAVFRIAFAWDQVLAGDIDDIMEGVEHN